MKFLFVNEGSRGEVDSYVGGLKQLDELIDSYISDREELVNEELDISKMNVSQSSKYDSFSENQPEAL